MIRTYRGCEITLTDSGAWWVAWTPGGRWLNVKADTLKGVKHMIRESLA